MKKIIILLILLIIPIAAATTTKVHEGWHEYRDQITKDGIIYDFFIQETNPDLLRFSAGSFNTIIRRGQCQQNQEYTYCYEDFDYEHEKTTISPSGNLVPGIKILIERTNPPKEPTIKSDFKLQATHTQRTELDQTNNLTIKLENNGETTIRNARITIIIPEGLDITTDSLIKLQTIIQSNLINQIRPEEQINHTLTYEPKKSGTHEIKIEIDYEEQQEKKQITRTLRVDVPKPYTISTSIPSRVELGQTFRYQIEIENKIEQDIEIQLQLEHPINLQTTRTQGVSLTRTRTHGQTRTLTPGQKETIYVEYRPINQQPITISGFLKIITQKEEYEEPLQKQLTVDFKALTQTLEIDRIDVTPNSRFRVTHKITNNNDNLELTDITTTIQGLIEETITTQRIRPKETITVYEETLTAPNIQENIAYQINATTRFRVSGVLNTITETKTINVLGDTTPILIDVRPSKTTAKPNETITIVVNIRNVADTPIHTLTVTDQFNKQITPIGRTNNVIELTGKQQRQAYTYQVQIPSNPTNNLVITTTAKNNQYEAKTNTTINIDSQQVILNQPTTQQEEQITTEEQDQIDEQITAEAEVIRHRPEQNFFARTYQRFSDFIRGLIR